MATISPIVLEGIVTADGDLELQTPLSLPPGPVRITLESIEQGERLPDPPWLDESISAPFDLPRSGKVEYVTPKYEKRIGPSPIIVEDADGDL